MTAYYNEHDRKIAAWLRELIRAGLIAPGDVDERDIRDVRPSELVGYTQCHFFAGIGTWSYALRLAGWPDDRPVWTGSCPCQPFSTAGKGTGFADERHLWPAWFDLIKQCGPVVVFGEQVASEDGRGWIDLVQADLEGAAYAVGRVNLCAAGVGAPNIRQRLFFVADASGSRGGRNTGAIPGAQGSAERQVRSVSDEPELGRGTGELADREGHRRQQGRRIVEERPGFGDDRGAGELADTERTSAARQRELSGASSSAGRLRDGFGDRGGLGELGDAGSARLSARQFEELFGARRRHKGRAVEQPSRSFWSDAEWIWCRDEKWRPVEPGSFPLVDGAAFRVVRLRGYGNAINAEVAAAFIESYLEAVA